MSSWNHNLLFLALLLGAGSSLKTLITTTGEQRVSNYGSAPIVLSNATELDTALGTLNILQELTALRVEVASLKNRTVQLETAQSVSQSVGGAGWTGLRCQCYLDNDTPNDAAILLGNYFVNGTLVRVEILQAVHAGDIFVTCEAIVNATILAGCDAMV